MNWESFDWTTLLWIGGLVLFVFLMLRGCGGMMGGGGCRGMGSRRADVDADPEDQARRKSPEQKL